MGCAGSKEDFDEAECSMSSQRMKVRAARLFSLSARPLPKPCPRAAVQARAERGDHIAQATERWLHIVSMNNPQAPPTLATTPSVSVEDEASVAADGTAASSRWRVAHSAGTRALPHRPNQPPSSRRVRVVQASAPVDESPNEFGPELNSLSTSVAGATSKTSATTSDQSRQLTTAEHPVQGGGAALFRFAPAAVVQQQQQQQQPPQRAAADAQSATAATMQSASLMARSFGMSDKGSKSGRADGAAMLNLSTSGSLTPYPKVGQSKRRSASTSPTNTTAASAAPAVNDVSTAEAKPSPPSVLLHDGDDHARAPTLRPDEDNIPTRAPTLPPAVVDEAHTFVMVPMGEGDDDENNHARAPALIPVIDVDSSALDLQASLNV